MKEKKLSRKQYKERWNFIGECRMLLEVEDFQMNLDINFEKSS